MQKIHFKQAELWVEPVIKKAKKFRALLFA